MRAIMRLQDTDVETLHRWFNYYSRRVIPARLYVSEDVSLTLQGPEVDSVDVGVGVIRVNGAFVVAGDDKPQWAPYVFTFKLVSLPFGLRVEANCYNILSVIVSLLELLASIMLDWENRVTLERLDPLGESLDTDRDLTMQDRYLMLRAMELENGLLATMYESEAEGPEPQPDISEPARTEAGGEAVGEMVRQWKAGEVSDLDLLRALNELEVNVLELPGVHKGTSSKPAKQADLLNLARRYIEAKQYNSGAMRSDIGSERTVGRGVALYKAIEKLA